MSARAPSGPDAAEEIRLISRRSKLVTHFLLAMALLVAQVGAQAHAYSHLQTSAAKSDFGAAGQLCLDCLSFAPVASPAGSPDAVQFEVSVDTPDQTRCPDALPIRQIFLSYYRSRAPPVLL